jgi:hypothetical protein
MVILLVSPSVSVPFRIFENLVATKFEVGDGFGGCCTKLKNCDRNNSPEEKIFPEPSGHVEE